MRGIPTDRESLLWLTACAAAFLTHAALAVTLPDQVWVTPAGTGLVLLVGLAFTLRWAGRTRGDMRLRWGLLAAAFALWIGGYAASAHSQLTQADTSLALPYLLLFALRGIPWFLALVRTSDRKILGHTHAFDLAQAVLFSIAAGALFFPQILAGETVSITPISGERAISYHEGANLLIATLALLFVRLQPTVAERVFARNLAVLLVSYALSALFVNHLIIDRIGPPPGSPAFLLGDLPVALFVIETLRTAGRYADNRALPRNVVRRTVLLLIPALMPIGVVLMAFAIAARQPASATALALLAIVLYAGRSVLTQHAYGQSQEHLIQARDTMARLAQRDDLTGLANRRHFAATLQARWTQCAEQHLFLSLLFVDVDHFKQYNDELGHAAGDECLRRVAQVIASNSALRESDLVARYGGEEFVILLPGTEPAAAAMIGERICKAIERSEIAHPAAALRRVSVSIGAATARPSAEGAEASALLKDADSALYWAKSHGRNRVAGPYVDSLGMQA
ncbi:MAG: GGDEF domain-containing protein [Dokdonella sp.]|jgi:diguanylate cyclase (GGDEF)-like protein|nr:GGDEF domain-containing protein [Dokdonella sp.]